MDEEPTCGKGVAENTVLPARLAAVAAAMAEVLEVHRKALDMQDPETKPEADAYTNLALELGEIAAKLQSTATEMTGYRDLPMGRHDEQALSGPEPRTAFETFVKAKADLLMLLEQQAEQDRQMLDEMRSPAH